MKKSKRDINVDSVMKKFSNTYVAHRGLFNNEKGVPENSLTAFLLAVKNGYGIELDVQLTKDGKLVVFHDDDLNRMCGKNIKVKNLTFKEIRKIKLNNSDEKIPLLSEVLELVNGRSPLLIEIKGRNRRIETAKKTAEELRNYKGIYCIESFSPSIVGWYRKKQSNVARGQLIPGLNKKHMLCSWASQLVLPFVLAFGYPKPDFLAYNHKMTDVISYRMCRLFYTGYNAAWTIKNENQLKKAKKSFDIFIFDSFIPDNK